MKIQAYRGVSTECPANTLPAFQSAVAQGYDGISLDVVMTRDNALVVHHDDALAEYTYAQLLSRDFGSDFSAKFALTRISVLEEVIVLAKRSGMRVSIRNGWQKLHPEQRENLYNLLSGYMDTAVLICDNAEALREAAQRLPEAAFGYDGPVCQACLTSVSALVPADRLTVWLSKEDTAQAALVKNHARLGIRLLTEYEEMDAAEALGADIVETSGGLKPVRNQGVLADMHTHSRNSHDATPPVIRVAGAAREAGVSIMAVTDHYDGFMCKENPDFDLYSNQLAAFDEAREVDKEMGDDFRVLAGIELGEGHWAPEQTKKLLDMIPFDVIIGATHAVKCPRIEGAVGMKQAFSQFPWKEMSREEILEFFDLYFDEVLYTVQTQNIDIMAHLGCPNSYIMRDKGWIVDLHPYEEKVRKILQTIIRRGIAMEIQTCYLDRYGTFTPQEWIIEMYRQMGGYLITMSTDCHDSRRAGVNFPEAVRRLKEMGFRNTFYLEDRSFRQCTL